MLKLRRSLIALFFFLFAGATAQAQAPRAYPFRATNYNVEVILHPENQTISAQAKVDFVATQVARTVLVELHADLQVQSVKGADGQPLTFGRDNKNPLLLTVALPAAATTGKQISLTFEYNGPISSEEDSPTPGVRFASVDKTSAYLLLPARWFPLTDYPSNRYTGTFNVIVPATMAVTGTGKSDPPTTRTGIGVGAPQQASYVFHCDQPGPVGSFVAGNLQLSPILSQGDQFSFFTPPSHASTVAGYANSLGQIVSYFSDAFGPLPAPVNLTVAQMPDGSIDAYAAPGLLLISARQWTANPPNDRVLARLAAAQWWGNRVLPATASDVWVTDGLSRYGEAMYAEQSDGVAGLHRALDDFAVGALMYEDTAPISQAGHLYPYSDEYRSIVAEKGAMVFHMLRAELGDDAFDALLRDFYKQHEGKTATNEEFQKMAEERVPPAKKGEPPVNLVSFFSQWLDSTGVPEFNMQYIVYRTPRGFRVVGKIQQGLDTFRMPVEVKIDTEGNPETKKFLVVGTTSQFQMETFGRPKPGGITIDPNNSLLKSSPRLRVRATVARGESLASAGKYYEAIQEYQRALEVQPGYSLAHFRLGEAMFYQKNYQAAANAFRASLGGDLDPKWVEVWSHIYIGKVYDLLGQRERAVNEYTLAQHTKDDTAGAQREAGRCIPKPCSDSSPAASTSASASPANGTPSTPAASSDGSNEPTLKRRDN